MTMKDELAELKRRIAEERDARERDGRLPPSLPDRCHASPPSQIIIRPWEVGPWKR